jgi:hypothetical protein
MTISQLKESIEIFGRHASNNPDEEEAILYQGHRIFSLGYGPEEVPEDSEDGKKLKEYGWFLHEGTWVCLAE